MRLGHKANYELTGPNFCSKSNQDLDTLRQLTFFSFLFNVQRTLRHVVFRCNGVRTFLVNVYYHFSQHSPDVAILASLTTRILYDVSAFDNRRIIKEKQVKQTNFCHIIGIIVEQLLFQHVTTITQLNGVGIYQLESRLKLSRYPTPIRGEKAEQL